MIVADTSLVVHALVSEDHRDVVEQVRHADNDWIAPPLWASEFRNVIATHVRTGRLPASKANQIWRVGRDLVRDAPIDPDAVLSLALDRQMSAYDAEFASLAMTLGTKVVTFDGGLFRTCPDLALGPEAFLAS